MKNERKLLNRMEKKTLIQCSIISPEIRDMGKHSRPVTFSETRKSRNVMVHFGICHIEGKRCGLSGSTRLGKLLSFIEMFG